MPDTRWIQLTIAEDFRPVYGGRGARARVPLISPAFSEEDADRLASDVRSIAISGMLTNGPFVRELEAKAQDYLGVKRCVAVSNCTAGLMLVLRASDLSGDVIVPSFTFAATAHAVAWNGLRPVWADVDPETLTLDAAKTEKAVGARTSAILATHLYGTPCDTEGLEEVARRHGIKLFFDAAHAFGSIHDGRKTGGFGDAEVFSLSPTKVMVAAEGGIIATNDEVLAERLVIGRDYANPGDYDCRFVGLNARMSELHAAVALRSFENLEDNIETRNASADKYREALAHVPGISFPVVPDGDRSTFKDFTILVEPDEYGMTAGDLAATLAAEGIETRRYYYPPVHKMRAYASVKSSTGL